MAALLLGAGAAPSTAFAWSLFDSDTPVRLGHEAFEEERWQDALDHWSEAQVDDPADRRLDYNIGQALYRLEDFPGAEEAFLAATATDRTGLAADAFYGAGNAAFQQGRYPDAITHYERCLELRPDDEDAQANRDLAPSAGTRSCSNRPGAAGEQRPARAAPRTGRRTSRSRVKKTSRARASSSRRSSNRVRPARRRSSPRTARPRTRARSRKNKSPVTAARGSRRRKISSKRWKAAPPRPRTSIAPARARTARQRTGPYPPTPKRPR